MFYQLIQYILLERKLQAQCNSFRSRFQLKVPSYIIMCFHKVVTKNLHGLSKKLLVWLGWLSAWASPLSKEYCFYTRKRHIHWLSERHKLDLRANRSVLLSSSTLDRVRYGSYAYLRIQLLALKIERLVFLREEDGHLVPTYKLKLRAWNWTVYSASRLEIAQYWGMIQCLYTLTQAL